LIQKYGQVSGSVAPPDLQGSFTLMNATTGIDGQSFWNTTYHALFKWTVDRWDCVYVDPRYGFILAHEEFTGQDRIGTLDWSNGSQLAGTSAAPGIYSISNGTAASVQRIGGQLNAIQLGTMDLFIETSLRFQTLSSSGDSATMVWGLNDGSAYDSHGACTDGVFFSLDFAIDSTHICTNTTSNSTTTQKISALAAAVPVANTFFRSNIAIIGSTSASFYVGANPFGGTPITTAHTTNLPTGAGRQTGLNLCLHKVVGATSQTLDIDYIKVFGFFNGSRVA
jgi:hypothetical protein